MKSASALVMIFDVMLMAIFIPILKDVISHIFNVSKIFVFVILICLPDTNIYKRGIYVYMFIKMYVLSN